MLRPAAALAFLVVGLATAFPRAGAAEPDPAIAAAKEHFRSGIALLKAENYAGAAVEFEESLSLYPTANALFNLANCYEALHRYAEALRAFERLLVEFEDALGDEMRDAAARHRDEIRDLVGELIIEVDVSGAAIAVDGRAVGTSPLDGPLLLGPGEYPIAVTRDGYVPAQRLVKLVSRTTQREAFELAPVERTLPEPPPAAVPAPAPPAIVDPAPPADAPPVARHPSPLFWAGLGFTAATAATAGAFWGLTAREHDRLTTLNEQVEAGEIRPGDPEHDELRATRDNGEMYQGLAIGFGVGAGALALATTVVLILDLRRDDPAAPALSVAPGGLTATF